MKALRFRSVNLAIQRHLAVGDQQDLRSAAFRKNGLLPFSVKPIAAGQFAEPFFILLKLGFETGIGGEVNIQPRHFREGDNAIEILSGNQAGEIGDEILIAPGVGPAPAAKRLDSDSFRSRAFPCAGRNRNIVPGLSAFLGDPETISLLPPVREIVEQRE